MWKNQGKGRSLRRKYIIVLIIFIVASGAFLYKYKTDVEPNIDSISELKAKGIISRIINSTLREEFKYQANGQSLLDVKTGPEGEIQMIEANTELINDLVSRFAVALQNKYAEEPPKDVEVSYGTVIGSKVLSQIGPSLTLRVLPISVSAFDFQTELNSEGINQSKYKVFIIIETKVKVLEPFSSSEYLITNKVLIAEAVILGEVPQSYVVVPEDNILDAIE